MENSEQIAEEAFNKFMAFHSLQLYAVQFPKELEKKLYEKLKQEIFDIGFKVKIIVNNDEERVDLIAQESGLKANEDVYLIDHAWTFKYRNAEKTLRENEKLLERMLNIVRYSNKLDLPSNPYEKKKPGFTEYLESITPQTKAFDFDEYGIKSLRELPLHESVEQLSLFNNELENPGEISSILYELPNLKALWLQGNPVVENCVNFQQIGEYLPALEILNSKFTTKAGEWSMLFYAAEQKVSSLGEIRELDLSSKGVLHMADLSVFDKMTSLKTLNLSDHPEFFKTEEEIKEQERILKEGSGESEKIEFLSKLHTVDELLEKLKYVRKLVCDQDLEDYIIENRDAKGFLPQLQEVNKISVKIVDKQLRQKEKNIRHVMDKIWMYAGTYRVCSEEQMDEENIWYITDEVGSSIKHSDEPNLAVHPFIYAPNNEFDSHTITYSICWPLKDAASNEPLYRDFLCGIDESKFRSTRLTVWYNTPEEYFAQQLEIYRNIKPDFDAMTVHNQIQEKYAPLPAIDAGQSVQLPVKVFTDYVQIQNHLKDPRFQLTEDPHEAKIIWSTMDYYNILRAQINLDEKDKYLNQFQYEGSFVMKHHLANLVRLTLQPEDQSIIQESIILNDYLPAFVGRFLELQKQCQENTWILKPINMARSMDMMVTHHLDQIIRTVETGPKIAQKYIQNPCTFKKKKFDMRFVAMLKSVLPLEVYVYDEYYTRHSNNEFEMNESSFSEYETHFTVINYKDGVKLTNIRYFDFEKEFNEEYEGVITFQVIKERIHSAIKKLFVAYQVKHSKDLEALGDDANRCRGMYGIDVMITDDFQPKILEATFSPDCKRACLFNPNFFNEVFGCLFFNDAKNVTKI